MLKLAEERDELKVDQFRMAPTGTASLAENMYRLLLTDEFGLFHMSCQGNELVRVCTGDSRARRVDKRS